MTKATEYDESLFPSAEAQKSAEAVWNEAAEINDKGSPTGQQTARINSAVFGEAASSGKPQIAYELEILIGESKGVKIRKYDGLSSAKQAAITQGQLNRIGVDTKAITITKLPAALLDAVGKTVQINCKQNDEFYNVTFNKLLTETVGGADAPAKDEI